MNIKSPRQAEIRQIARVLGCTAELLVPNLTRAQQDNLVETLRNCEKRVLALLDAEPEQLEIVRVELPKPRVQGFDRLFAKLGDVLDDDAEPMRSMRQCCEEMAKQRDELHAALTALARKVDAEPDEDSPMTFHENDPVTKGDERGIVVRRVGRSGRGYLTVKILTGPRAGRGEFPEHGWSVDETADPGRPARDPETPTYHPAAPYQSVPDDDDLPF